MKYIQQGEQILLALRGLFDCWGILSIILGFWPYNMYSGPTLTLYTIPIET